MFLLPSVVVGLVLARLLGGRPSRVAEIRLRAGGTVLLALAIQIVLFSRVGASVPGDWRNAIHLASYALLVVFAVANIHVRALATTVVGMVLNATAIAVNGGRMPLSPAAAHAAGIHVAAGANVSAGAHRLWYLGDVFALPARLPLANAFSIGDVLIGVGIVGFVVSCSFGATGRRVFDLRRLTAPLDVRDYRLLASGRLVSHVGDWITLAGLVGWVYGRTGSTAHVAVLMLARLAPPVLGGGLAAVVADRLPKSRLLVALELARAALVAGALAAVATGSLAGVLLALACSGCLAAMSNAAASSIVPALLPSGQLAAANAALGVAKDVAMAFGALAAAIVLAHVGIAAALTADTATFVFAAVLYLRIAVPRRTALPAAEGEHDARARTGLLYLLGRRRLLFVVLAFGAATAATGLANASLPRFLGSGEGIGPGAYGYGIAALAGGLAVGEALVGLLDVGALASRWIGIALLGMAALFVLLGLTAHAPSALLLLVGIGFVDGTTDVLFDTVVQREADPARLGSAFGFASMLTAATMMSAFGAAPLLNAIAAPGTVVLCASAFLVAAGSLALLATPWRARSRLVPASLSES